MVRKEAWDKAVLRPAAYTALPHTGPMREQYRARVSQHTLPAPEVKARLASKRPQQC